ncbi:S-adenosyl-L-methionine-dependent methyltransferase [Chytriomyces sp. MP71]|nr:S-adenosyl-L-methionine-dependent methyltransferase [Chytriomyces sp. MP71]
MNVVNCFCLDGGVSEFCFCALSVQRGTRKGTSDQQTMADGSLASEDNTQFSSQEYWDERYKKQADGKPKEETFEWLKGWSFYKETVTPLIQPSDRILHLGIGNSTFSVDMVMQSGIRHHVNVDYSPNVIEHMRERFAEHGETVQWVVADIFKLTESVERASFDVVVDKGTLDAFLTAFPDDDPWDPSEECWNTVRAYMGQVNAAMKPGGTFIQITWAQPHFRKRFLEVTGMEVSTKKVGDDWEYFVYVCKKKE